MKLRRSFFEIAESAAGKWGQIGYRRDAVAYALAGITRQHDAVLDAFGHDPIMSEMEGTMRAWVAETLIQGAYLREYHLWEKDCKAYFPAMAAKNGEVFSMKPRPRQPFPSMIWELLSQFSVSIPDDISGAIEHMRDRVNVMKHDAGLTLGHFITEEDYTAGVEALEEFWNHLMNVEEVGP